MSLNFVQGVLFMFTTLEISWVCLCPLHEDCPVADWAQKSFKGGNADSGLSVLLPFENCQLIDMLLAFSVWTQCEILILQEQSKYKRFKVELRSIRLRQTASSLLLAQQQIWTFECELEKVRVRDMDLLLLVLAQEVPLESRSC